MEDPNGADKTIDTGVATVLADYERDYEAGYEIAGIDALRFCRQQRLPLPDWLADVVTDKLTSYLAGKKAPGKGRSASPLAKYLVNYKDHCRWRTVQDVLCADAAGGESSDGHPGPYLRKTTVKRSTQLLPDMPLHQAFEQARLELRGGIARGSLKTMERAYWRIQGMRKKGARVYLARRDTLADLGVEMPEQSSECSLHG